MDLTRKQALTGLAGILATGVAPAAFVRSMLGARTTAFSKSSGSAWVNPYVTDGLMLFGDSEWNAGGGVHTPDASMANLGSGDGVISLSADCVVGANSVTISGGDGLSAVGTGFDFSNNNGGTIEVVGKFSQYNVGARIFMLNSNGWFSGDNYNIKWGYDGGWNLEPYSPANGARFKLWTRGANKFGSTPNCAYLGSLISRTNNFSRFSSDASTFYAGKNMKGEIYSFRVYDRVLSLEELEANTQVDSQRFGIGGGYAPS